VKLGLELFRYGKAETKAEDGVGAARDRREAGGGSGQVVGPERWLRALPGI
jgi:hypothetical protein